VSTVTYRQSGNGLTFQAIARSALTAFGWLTIWGTTTVQRHLQLVSDAAYLSGINRFSLPVLITVDNPLPTTSILVPSKKAATSQG
jgi:hypothetical protein